MKIHLRLPDYSVGFLDTIEQYRMILGAILSGLFLILYISQAVLRVTSRLELLLDISAGVLLGGYFLQLRKRHSLKWKSDQLLATLREPAQIDITREMSSLYRFKSISSVLIVCGITSLLFLPRVSAFPRLHGFAPASVLVTSAKPDFFSALWQVHAAFIGFFLVLLTFVFQFVSVKWAYESSLLPSLAKRAWLSFALVANLISLLYEMFVCLSESAGKSNVFLRYFAIVTLIFSIVSALFIFLKVKDFLQPDSLENCLSEEVRSDLALAVEDEQRRAVTQYLMEQECVALGLEYSTFDFRSNMQGVVIPQSGIVRDVNLARLRQLAKALFGSLPRTSEQSSTCVLCKTIGDELQGGVDVIARMASKDSSPQIQRLALKVFKITSVN
jgi:hypothetical protein